MFACRVSSGSVLVMQVTDNILNYSSYVVASNILYAERMNYDIIVVRVREI